MVFRYVFNLWIGLGLAGLAVCALPPQAQAQGVSIIRDAETEQLLREYVIPIFKAAGIRNDAVKIILVGDKSFNAFVADGQKIFVNVGALMEAKTPNEIIGVLAHESGHIAGGHLVQMHQELARLLEERPRTVVLVTDEGAGLSNAFIRSKKHQPRTHHFILVNHGSLLVHRTMR